MVRDANNVTAECRLSVLLSGDQTGFVVSNLLWLALVFKFEWKVDVTKLMKFQGGKKCFNIVEELRDAI